MGLQLHVAKLLISKSEVDCNIHEQDIIRTGTLFKSLHRNESLFFHICITLASVLYTLYLYTLYLRVTGQYIT